MATYLLDISGILDALNGKRGRRDRLLNLVKQAIFSPAADQRHRNLRRHATERGGRYGGVPPEPGIYHLTMPVARMAGLLKRDLGHKGTTITVADATIAAVALGHELTLMTDNLKDSPNQGLILCPLPAN